MKGGDKMFLSLFSNPEINILTSCCACGCGCSCNPTSAESAGRKRAAEGVSGKGSSTDSSPSA